jgi:hypothetical protein
MKGSFTITTIGRSIGIFDPGFKELIEVRVRKGTKKRVQARYLCKRLRARFPNLKIVVGRWGVGSDDSNSILIAGADRVGTTMIETREQMIQLSQISSHSEAQSGATANPFSPVDALLKMT